MQSGGSSVDNSYRNNNSAPKKGGTTPSRWTRYIRLVYTLSHARRLALKEDQSLNEFSFRLSRD